VGLTKTTKNGKASFRVSFWNCEGKLQSIRLGFMQKRHAESIASYVQSLAEAARAGTSPEPHILSWVRSVEEDLRTKLLNAGLVANARAISLKELLASFIKNQSVKPATLTKFEQVSANLLAYYPDDQPIRKITAGSAADFRAWLAKNGNIRDKIGENARKTLSDNTVRRRTGIATQIFNYAIKHKWIDDNPFKDLPCTVHENARRQYFVPVADVQLAIDTAPNAEWRAIIALSRYGGIRIPSELTAMTWADVDIEGRRMTIRASKTEHHADAGIRVCPIFPELMPYLNDLYILAQENKRTPDDFVFETRGSETIYRSGFLRILRRAKIAPWVKLFHNMRASRQTELFDSGYPIKSVCKWLGNSPQVAMKHYAMAREEHLDRASELTDDLEAQRVAQQLAHSAHITGYQEATELNAGEGRICENSKETEYLQGSVNVPENGKMGEEGLEPTTSTL